MADISKIKLPGGTEALIKDAAGRQNVSTLTGAIGIQALGTAALQNMAPYMQGTGIADAPTVKAYVDAQIGAIHKFDVVVCPAEAAKIPAGAIYKDGSEVITGTLAASADTMYKIYLVKNSDTGKDAYDEWISIKTGETTYTWEKIGVTAPELKDYVKKTTQIAGVAINDGIAKADLQTALELKGLAYAAQATGSTTLDTIDSITLKKITVAGDATVTYTSTSMNSTGTFTPSGSITGSAISDGSITVTVKDAATATDATVGYGTQTVNPTVEKATGATVSYEKTTSNTVSSATPTEGKTANYTPSGTVSKPNITLTSSDQAILQGVTSAGTLPSFKDDIIGTFAAGTTPSIVTADTWNFAIQGTTDDPELLVITGTNGSVQAGTAPTWTGGTFNQGSMPKFNSYSVKNVTEASLAAAPEFTGTGVVISATPVTASTQATVTDATYRSSVSVQSVTGATYVKQQIDTATFQGTAATLGFSGTEGDLSVSGNYDKANATAAYSTDVTPETNVITKTAKTITIVSDPKAE